MNKVAIITGSNGGIGQAACKKFNEANYTVIGLDRTEMSSTTNDIDFYKCDLLDEENVKDTIEKIIDKYSKIDVLFNTAGGSGRKFGDGPIDLCTEEGFDKTLALNLKVLFHINKFVIKKMIESNSGCIINLSSVLGMVGGGKHFATHAYAASKAAIIGLTRAMAIEYADRNIRVNVIAAGLIETPMSKRAQNDSTILEYMKKVQPIYQNKNKLGQPESIAQAAVFLASDESDFITGIVLPIDGGWTAL